MIAKCQQGRTVPQSGELRHMDEVRIDGRRILRCDCYPKEVEGREERLKSALRPGIDLVSALAILQIGREKSARRLCMVMTRRFTTLTEPRGLPAPKTSSAQKCYLCARPE